MLLIAGTILPDIRSDHSIEGKEGRVSDTKEQGAFAPVPGSMVKKSPPSQDSGASRVASFIVTTLEKMQLIAE